MSKNNIGGKTIMMTSAFSIAATHARALPSNVVAQRYGNHMPSIQVSTDTDSETLPRVISSNKRFSSSIG